MCVCVYVWWQSRRETLVTYQDSTPVNRHLSISVLTQLDDARTVFVFGFSIGVLFRTVFEHTSIQLIHSMPCNFVDVYKAVNTATGGR